MIGKTFEKLTVETEHKTSRPYLMWECRCECGNRKAVKECDLVSGDVTSCGCQGLQKLVDLRRSVDHFNVIWEGVKGLGEWETYESFESEMRPPYDKHVAKFGERNTHLNVANRSWTTKIAKPDGPDSWTFNKYQFHAADTAQYPFVGENIYYAALGLASEAGEVCGVAKRIIRDHNCSWDDKILAQMKAEIGDCLWYLSALCDEFGITLEDAAKYNVEKLASRKSRGVIGGAGDNR